MTLKVAVITGTRAEYGLLSPLMHLLKDDPGFALQLIVTGSHLSPRHGMTVRYIEEDGFAIDARVDLDLSGDEPGHIMTALARATDGIGRALLQLQPDLVVVLGDRYEILGAAQAAMIARIPVAHIHGGEVTEGAMDESIRHAITKMSHLHFASTAEHAGRIRQLGENPAHIFNVGAPGLDNIRTLKLLKRGELATSLDFDLGEQFLLVTYHPVTLGNKDDVAIVDELLDAFEDFPEYKLIITFPNADTHGQRIANHLKDYVSGNQARAVLSESLGQIRYLSALKEAAAVVGNSSSGIIEAPSLGTPTVNIGIRQKGRVAAESVIHSADDRKSITSALQKALSPEFRKVASSCQNPYGSGHASEQIINLFRNIDFAELKSKPFFDIPQEG